MNSLINRVKILPLVGFALLTAAIPGLSSPARASDSGRWNGFFALENRLFSSGPSFEGQEGDSQGSIAFETDYYRELSREGESLSLKLFGRLDSVDAERTHLDVRELVWQKAGRSWNLAVGIDKVFWGVTESQHLVDIINQTDLVENPDGEEKLGQPMVRLSLIRDWGILDLFALLGFRERTFPGEEGRLRPGPPISDDPRYESIAKNGSLDLALRWSHAIGPLDVGVSHFRGTAREPRLLGGLSVDGEPRLVPYYDLIDQSGLDLQATLSSWLLKLEAIHRSGQGESFAALTAGFEYTFYGVLGSRVDVGALSEVLWDERGAEASSPFARDVFVGSRLAFNDAQGTEVLAGVIVDADTSATFVQVEASRRVGRGFRVEAEVRAVSGAAPQDPLAMLQADDHFQLSISRHF
jgi:hypothetical protein